MTLSPRYCECQRCRVLFVLRSRDRKRRAQRRLRWRWIRNAWLNKAAKGHPSTSRFLRLLFGKRDALAEATRTGGEQ